MYVFMKKLFKKRMDGRGLLAQTGKSLGSKLVEWRTAVVGLGVGGIPYKIHEWGGLGGGQGEW